MSNITLIVLSAGESSRFKNRVKKQWLRIGDKPLWLFVIERLKSFYDFDEVIITSTEKELNYMKLFCEDKVVLGGATRQESLKNAIENVNSEYVLVTDVARCCIDKDMFLRVIDSRGLGDCIVPYLKVADTTMYEDELIDRTDVKLIQTPQLSKTNLLKKAIKSEKIFTDDSSLIKSIGGQILYVEGSKKAEKLTFVENLKSLHCIKKPNSEQFIGNGFDVHGFEDGKVMKLGGVTIDVPFGFKAHSDGDVLIHSLIDALLGAIGFGDIGELFPDSDNRYKNIDSTILLNEVVSFLHKVGFTIVNIDVTIIAQTPKLLEYKGKIRNNLANLLQIEKTKTNIKATTTEHLGFIGRKEGVGVLSIVNLKYFDWTR
jgi:2-C-methyl-D-erythritol 4-phosphate cytidylyltransferase/2-C-methyl-D-erythritol 2,4-cyclodiphosphate synthase